MSKNSYSREKILEQAKEVITKDRNEQYGEPENNFEVIASLWSDYIRSKKIGSEIISSKDVAVMMALFKIGRITTSNCVKPDSFVDAAGYIACAYECAENDEEDTEK